MTELGFLTFFSSIIIIKDKNVYAKYNRFIIIGKNKLTCALLSYYYYVFCVLFSLTMQLISKSVYQL